MAEYIAHVDGKWEISKDYRFNTAVVEASFCEKTVKWRIKLSDGCVVQACWLIPAVVFASSLSLPSYPGMDMYGGRVYHTADWPRGDVDLSGQRVAVIGTGTSGVQVVQDIRARVKHLTVYQRTPNLALPKVESEPYVSVTKAEAIKAFRKTRTTFTSFHPFHDEATFNSTPAERQAFFENLYGRGNFNPWMGTYKDTWYNEAANSEAYSFWAQRTRARIRDPRKRDLLAPLKAPHPLFARRPAVETNYFETLDHDNVTLVSIKHDPIIHFTSTGIQTADNIHRVFDTIILATGFGSMADCLFQLNIRGSGGQSLNSAWRNGSRSYLGVAAPGFPNLFFLAGPQAPLVFTNGPSTHAIQVEWLCGFLDAMKRRGVRRCEAMIGAESCWRERIAAVYRRTMFHNANLFYSRKAGQDDGGYAKTDMGRGEDEDKQEEDVWDDPVWYVFPSAQLIRASTPLCTGRNI